jgi:hypothetical protein
MIELSKTSLFILVSGFLLVGCMSERDLKQEAANKKIALSKMKKVSEDFELYIRNKDPERRAFLSIEARPDSHGNGGALYIMTSQEWDSAPYRSRLRLVQTIGKAWQVTVPSEYQTPGKNWGYVYFRDQLGLETGSWTPVSGAKVPEN